MDATYARMTLNWDRGLQSLMSLHKMNDYIVITSKQACKESWIIRATSLQHGNKKANVSRSIQYTKTPLRSLDPRTIPGAEEGRMSLQRVKHEMTVGQQYENAWPWK